MPVDSEGKFNVRIEGKRVIISGRPPWTKLAKNIDLHWVNKEGKLSRKQAAKLGGNSMPDLPSLPKGQDGNEDRRHVIAYAGVLRPACAVILSIGLEMLSEEDLIKCLLEFYKQPGVRLSTSPPSEHSGLKEHAAFLIKELNSVVNNLNPGSAIDNQASEAFRDATDTLREKIHNCFEEACLRQFEPKQETAPKLKSGDLVVGAPTMQVGDVPGDAKPAPPSFKARRQEFFRTFAANESRQSMLLDIRFSRLLRDLAQIVWDSFASEDEDEKSPRKKFIDSDKWILVEFAQWIATSKLPPRFQVAELMDALDDFEFSTVTDISPAAWTEILEQAGTPDENPANRESPLQTRFALHFSDLIRGMMAASTSASLVERLGALFHFFHMPPPVTSSLDELVEGCSFCEQVKSLMTPVPLPVLPVLVEDRSEAST